MSNIKIFILYKLIEKLMLNFYILMYLYFYILLIPKNLRYQYYDSHTNKKDPNDVVDITHYNSKKYKNLTRIQRSSCFKGHCVYFKVYANIQ